MYKSLILPFAQQDIQDAAQWYNSKQKGLGKKFVQQIREKVTFIKQYPKAYAERYDDTRTAILDSFPFMIHYTLDEQNKTIIIAAVFHMNRNPSTWKNRKP